MSEQSTRVLVVDDEPQIQRWLRTSLSAQAYCVATAGSGEEAVAKASTERPDVVLLDLGLPDIDGVEVIGRIREWSNVPIIVVSVRGREEDKIAALDRGADDYITKPFGMGELIARIRAALRHRLQAQVEEPVFHSGRLAVDLAKRIVTLDNHEVKLTPKEYELLRSLVMHADRVLTHEHLLRDVWGPWFTRETHYLRIYVGQLRRKIEPDPAQPRYIITEPGVGYRLRIIEEERKC
jgi:two-component system KDP operon response regulator KdpE